MTVRLESWAEEYARQKWPHHVPGRVTWSFKPWVPWWLAQFIAKVFLQSSYAFPGTSAGSFGNYEMPTSKEKP